MFLSDPAVPHTPTRWQAFTAAPHRMLFFLGVCQAVLAMAWWAVELFWRLGLWRPPPTVLPPAWVHLYLMLYGLFPFFVFGFLFTVYPRWMSAPVVPPARYVPVFLLLAGGLVLFYPGLFISSAVLALAVALMFVGWVMALYSLVRVYRAARNRGMHERILNAALAAGAAGIAAYLLGMLRGDAFFFNLARELGLWLFLVPVLFSVGHRMIPFFSEAVLPHYTLVRPAWSLPLMGVCVLGHAATELSGFPEWRFVFDLPLGLAALYHSWAWGLRRSLEVRMLAMLHIAFAWLGIGLVLYALQSLALLAGLSPPARAPLHALAIGFVAGMAVAMAARVTLGHSGRPLVADALTWYAFLGVNVVALLRIAAEFWHGPAGHALNTTAAAAWLVCLLPWAIRYAPMYWRARADGNPG